MNTKFGAVGHLTIIRDSVVCTKAYKDGPFNPESDIMAEANISIGRHSRIDDWVKLEGGGGLTIGDHVHIASFAHLNIGGGITEIHDGAAVASGGKIVSGGNAPDSISCSASADVNEQVLHIGKVVIGKNACLYTNSCVMPNVTIGEGARILPGAIVTRDVPPFEIWGGVPAKRVRNVIMQAEAK